MPAEVYSATRPAVRYRAWLISGVLLAMAVALAADFVYRGAGPGVLGDRIIPDGWEMQFRVPSQFHEVPSRPGRFSSTYAFRATAKTGEVVELIFWRIRPGEPSAAWVAREILSEAHSWITLLLGLPQPEQAEGRLGGQVALEVHDRTIHMLIRTVILDSGWGYAVSLRVAGAPVGESLYRLFDLTCKNVQFHPIS